jgi:flagellar export protein FliJ
VGKFVFNLETLLRFREDVEQKERDELFRRTFRHQMELRRRDELNAKYHETMNSLSQTQTERPAGHELICYNRYLDRLTREIHECEQCLQKLQSEVQQQKETVIEASKKRKTLGILRQKKEKEYLVNEEKRMQQEIDDLVVTRYVSK